MVQKTNTPRVSIVVPVYGVEKQLYVCLQSVVFQTLEDIEVIVVNDCSPDNSQTIIDEFVQRFPDKVRCINHETNQGVAFARRTGLRAARAPYVIFVDSDDFISGDLCAVMVEKMETEGLDMAFFPALNCFEGSQRHYMYTPPEEVSRSTLLRRIKTVFWCIMYRRGFLLEHEDISFFQMFFEDAPALTALVSRACRLGTYREKPLYFYRVLRENSITATRMVPKKTDDYFAVDFIGWSNMKPGLEKEFAGYAMDRAAFTLGRMGEIYDYSVAYTKKLAELVPMGEADVTVDVQQEIDRALALPDEVCIPKTVYVNGFLREQLKDFDAYLEQAKKAYLFDPEVVVLDETTCELSRLPGWITDDEDKGLYFAVRAIHERGGVYISPAVHVVTSFNREAFQGTFFVAGPEHTVLPCVFGGAPGNPLVASVLATAEKEQTLWKRETIADCMAHVLIGEAGVHLNGRNEYGRCGLHMLSFSAVCRAMNIKASYSILDYSNYAGTADGMLAIPPQLSDFAWELAAAQRDAAVRKAKKG